MDYDLWLRLGEKFPFTFHLDEICAFYRVYGDNKTGRVFATPQRELGRAFRASISRRRESERKISFIVPVFSLDDALKRTIESVISQDLMDIELLLVDALPSKELSKTLREVIESVEECTTVSSVRIVKSDISSFEAAAQSGILAARSPIFCLLRNGDVVEKHAATTLLNYFAHDPHGAIIITGPDSEKLRNLGDSSNRIVTTNSILSIEQSVVPFAARKIVLEEFGSFLHKEVTSLSVRGFLLGCLNRGWLIVDSEKSILSGEAFSTKDRVASDKLMAQFAKARLILDAFNDAQRDLFHGTRASSGYAPLFPKENIELGQKILSHAPSSLDEGLTLKTLEELERLLDRYPSFAPGWLALLLAASSQGDTVKEQWARSQLVALRPDIADCIG